MKIGITTIPFDKSNIALLESDGHEVAINPFKKKIKYDQIYNFLSDCDAVIAGTEQYDEKLLKKLINLRFISRVGVGTDNIDLAIASELGIEIANTPDEPAEGVAEYCLGLVINFLRDIHMSNLRMKQNIWQRNMSLSISDAKISLIGGGRVSKKLCELLLNCGAKNIFVTDIVNLNKDKFWSQNKVTITNIDDMYDSDILSFHLPLTAETKNMVNEKFISKLSNQPYLINSSRGEIFNEDALMQAIIDKKIQGAAMDVFNKEPYDGPLLNYDEIITTPHIASTSKSVRYNMEKTSCRNLLRLINES